MSGGASSSETWPLRTREQAVAYLARGDAADTIVVFEFSGALLLVLRAAGVQAISVDLRSPEHDGPSFQGDFRILLHLKMWEKAFFVGPSCYQHLRRDIQCLPAKMRDGRAYWGGAMVIWCICSPYARVKLVEQPDTIVHDYLDVGQMPGVEVVELRTAQLGDVANKFMRFTLVNGELPPLPTETRAPPNPSQRRRVRRLTHFEHATTDERDRARSTWRHFPRLCEYVARLVEVDCLVEAELSYATTIAQFAARWREAGHSLPPDHDNSTGEPLSGEAKAYQLVRGPGDGRSTVGAAFERAAPAARRAEPGDQVVVTSAAAALLKLVDRARVQGRVLTAAQLDGVRRLECSPEGEADYLAFFNAEPRLAPKAWLSNYFEVTLRDEHMPAVVGGAVVNGVSFGHVEQYMHYAKALVFQDLDAAKAILSALKPRECKYLGRKVKGFDAVAWADVAEVVVERAVYQKFRQNPPLLAFLMATGERRANRGC